MATLISNKPEQTRQLAHEWARTAPPGWVIGLSGDLGAGKTEFVKGFAAGLGIKDRITSPTFALVNEHRGGRLPLYHLDLYRLENAGDIMRSGLESYFYQTDGVTIVEWVERWLGGGGSGGPAMRLVQFFEIDESTRRIDYEDISA